MRFIGPKNPVAIALLPADSFYFSLLFYFISRSLVYIFP